MVVIETTGNSRVSRQVFIPYFPEVRGGVQIESVNMIDENGENITVDVDMYRSRTYDWYNTATGGAVNGANNRDRMPGLYYMDASDTDPNVYVVQRMSPEDIRDSGVYLVGFVNESAYGNTGTLADRHVQVEKKFRPENADTQTVVNNTTQYPWVTDFDSNTARATNTTPVNADGVTHRFFNNNVPVRNDANYANKNVTDSTKLYLYSGSNSNAKVTDLTVEPNNILAQYRHDNAGTDVSGLNERWDGNDPAYFGNGTDGNRNEVLVRYNGGNIVYAVAFEEASNRYAQQVWWNCLPLVDAPDAPAGAPTVTFYNKTVTGTAAGTQSITVTYQEALTALAAGNKLSTTGKTSQMYEGGVLVADPATRLGTVATTGESYTLAVTNDDGVIYNFTLNVQAKAQDPGEPESTDPARVKIENANRNTQTLKVIINKPAQITLAQFEGKLKSKIANPYGNADDKVTVKAWTGNTELVSTDRMDHVTKIEITVTNRDGKANTWTADGANVVLNGTIAGQWVTVEKDTGVKVNTSAVAELTNASVDATTDPTNVYVYAEGNVQLKQSVNGAAATNLVGTSTTVAGKTYTYAVVNLHSFADGTVVKFSVAPITDTNYAVTTTGDVTSNTAYITKNASLNGKSVILTATTNDTVVTIDSITVGGTKVPSNYYTVTSVAGTSATKGTATIAFNAWAMTGDMVINSKVSTVNAYVVENSTPIEGESRPAYNNAYKDAGIQITTNGNTINITASESALIAYATSADANKVANTALMVNTDPGDGNTYLFAGATINAPEIAQSVKYKIGAAIDSEVLAETPVARDADKFVDNGVHFYFELIMDENGGTPSASWVSIANKTYSHRIGLQFYSDNAGNNKLGGVQYYDVNVTVTP